MFYFYRALTETKCYVDVLGPADPTCGLLAAHGRTRVRAAVVACPAWAAVVEAARASKQLGAHAAAAESFFVDEAALVRSAFARISHEWEDGVLTALDPTGDVETCRTALGPLWEHVAEEAPGARGRGRDKDKDKDREPPSAKDAATAAAAAAAAQLSWLWAPAADASMGWGSSRARSRSSSGAGSADGGAAAPAAGARSGSMTTPRLRGHSARGRRARATE